MAIVEQGFLVGGGPEVESGKAHVYFSDKPLEDIAYKSGVRASAKFELVVDTEIAMYFGTLFFRTVSDGVLTTDRVHPRAVLGIRDTTTDETVWNAEATELIKLGKDMLVASPESYLCFTTHPLEEPAVDDPMENIAEPPAKVAKTAEAGWSRKALCLSPKKQGFSLRHQRHQRHPHQQMCQSQKQCCSPPQSREEDGCKGICNTARPRDSEGSLADKANASISTAENHSSRYSSSGSTREKHRGPKDSAKGEGQGDNGCRGRPQAADRDRQGRSQVQDL